MSCVTAPTSPPVIPRPQAPRPPTSPSEHTELPTTISPGWNPLRCRQYSSLPDIPAMFMRAPKVPQPIRLPTARGSRRGIRQAGAHRADQRHGQPLVSEPVRVGGVADVGGEVLLAAGPVGREP